MSRLLAERMDTPGHDDTARIRAALLVGGCFLLVLHGTGSAFVLAYAGLFYTLGRLLAGRAICIPMVWLAAALCIAVADQRILPEESMQFGSLLGPSAAFLDAAPFTGVYHWSHSIKLMLLRFLARCFEFRVYLGFLVSAFTLPPEKLDPNLTRRRP